MKYVNIANFSEQEPEQPRKKKRGLVKKAVGAAAVGGAAYVGYKNRKKIKKNTKRIGKAFKKSYADANAGKSQENMYGNRVAKRKKRMDEYKKSKKSGKRTGQPRRIEIS